MRISQTEVAVIGAGPAGLMAAETIAQGGGRVTVYDAMPSAGRKFLMAGRRKLAAARLRRRTGGNASRQGREGFFA
jgi:predicted flavoprotein YhiN